MVEETGAKEISTEQLLPSGDTVAGGGGGEGEGGSTNRAGAEVVRKAPDAVKRSMPMALSITLGLLLAAAAGLFLYKLTWFLLILYLSLIGATVLEAPVKWMTRHKIKRGIAAMLVMLGGAVLIAGLLFLIGNGISGQVSALSKNMQDAPKKINDFVVHTSQRFPGLGERLKDFDVGSALTAVLPSMSAVVSNTMVGVETASWVVIMFFLVLYMLVDGADHLKAMRALLPKNVRLEATKLFNDISRAHRGWALASAANVASSSVLTGTGLFLIGVPAAFILGFFAGLGELVPNIGPILAALPALLFTLVAAPDKFLWVVGMFLVVWTIQGYTISPMMMKFSVELPVLVTIIAVLVFGTLFGVLGILVSIPLVADMVVVWHFWAARREKDCIDYDAVNNEPAERRQPMRVNNEPSWRLQKLFRRSRQRGRNAEEAAKGSMGRLEEAERKAGS